MTIWYADDALWAGEEARRHAGNKAREDITAILKEMGFEQLPVFSHEVHDARANAIHKLQTHRKIANAWDKSLLKASSGDVVVVQFPLVNHTLEFGKLVAAHEKRGVRIILVIHDLEAVRAVIDSGLSRATKFRIMREEVQPLRCCSVVIAHNGAMADVLAREFNVNRTRIVELGLFDYLAAGKADNSRFSVHKPIAICGSLKRGKAGYIYRLPTKPYFNLYGIGYETDSAQENVNYYGSFLPEELLDRLEGSFGLVWDGPDASTCTGPYGNYLRVNNPHKASLYLSAGMPIVIWGKSALAGFVKSNGVGLVIDNLDDLDCLLNSLNEGAYSAMSNAALLVSAKVRSGMYSRQAFNSALAICDC